VISQGARARRARRQAATGRAAECFRSLGGARLCPLRSVRKVESRRFFSAWLWGLLTFATLWATSLYAVEKPAQVPEEDVRKSVGWITKSLDVQQHLPNEKDSHERESKHERKSDGEFEDDSDSGFSVPAASAIWELLQWVVLGVGLIALASFIAEWFAQEWIAQRQGAGGRPLNAPVGGGSASQESAESALAKAEELAAQHRYGEAMHYVLLAALILLARDMGEEAADSFTSRELLSVAKLQPSARQPLRSLVTAVERAWFGKTAANEDDYRNARASFRDFSAAWSPQQP